MFSILRDNRLFQIPKDKYGFRDYYKTVVKPRLDQERGFTNMLTTQ